QLVRLPRSALPSGSVTRADVLQALRREGAYLQEPSSNQQEIVNRQAIVNRQRYHDMVTLGTTGDGVFRPVDDMPSEDQASPRQHNEEAMPTRRLGIFTDARTIE